MVLRPCLTGRSYALPMGLEPGAIVTVGYAAVAFSIKAGYLLVASILFALPLLAGASLKAGPKWQGGGGKFDIEPPLPPRPGHQAGPADRTLQETEARQMLEAKSFRLQRRGEEPLDVEAETERQLADLIGWGT